MSFAKASEHLRELLGVKLAPETARTLVQAHGRAMATFQPKDQATARAFRQAQGEIELAIDAGKVNTREEGWKDLKIAVISKREAGTAVIARASGRTSGCHRPARGVVRDDRQVEAAFAAAGVRRCVSWVCRSGRVCMRWVTGPVGSGSRWAGVLPGCRRDVGHLPRR